MNMSSRAVPPSTSAEDNPKIPPPEKSEETAPTVSGIAQSVQETATTSVKDTTKKDKREEGGSVEGGNKNESDEALDESGDLSRMEQEANAKKKNEKVEKALIEVYLGWAEEEATAETPH